MERPDLQFYTDVYRGTAVPPEDFPRLMEGAWRYLMAVTRSRAAGEAEAAVPLAACAVADALAREEAGGALQAETVGSHAVRYAPDASSAAARLYRAAALYLQGTDLLYRGI